MKIRIFTISTAIIIAFLSLSIFSSCEKDAIDNKSQTTNNQGNSYSVQNGYLVFETTEAFNYVLNTLASFSEADREYWEKSIGFKSQQSIINEIIVQENLYDSICSIKYANMDIQNVDESLFHSEAYNKYLEKGVIMLIDKGTDNEYWDYAIYNKGFANFINEDGLYAIGDTLYHVTENSLMALKDADFTKVDLLMKATETDEPNHIYQEYIKSTLKTYTGCPGLITTINDAWTSSGSKRIKIQIFLDVRYTLGTQINPGFDFYHEVYVQCQAKNFWGNWKYVPTQISINGSWTMRMFKNPNIYTNSYSYNVPSASYFKTCINPATGVSPGYQYTFQAYCNNPDPFGEDYNYPPQFEHYNWSAVRDGGCCGLISVLNK